MRRFGKDWGRRVWLYDRLVWAMVGYGAEIWGWKGRERVEALQGKVFEMGVGGRLVHSGVHGQRGDAAGHDEGKGGDEGMDV